MGDAILLLAGGYATRFPGKLERPVNGVPMLARVFENLRHAGWPVYVAGRGALAPALEARLAAPLLIDRWPPSGPLYALLSAGPFIPAQRIFAVAGDQPQLDAGVLERLAAAWQAGDEAAVPRHQAGIEPLAALYDRLAVLREGARLRRLGRRAMRDLVASLATRFVPLEERHFCNANEVSDLPEKSTTT